MEQSKPISIKPVLSKNSENIDVIQVPQPVIELTIEDVQKSVDDLTSEIEARTRNIANDQKVLDDTKAKLDEAQAQLLMFPLVDNN